MWELVNRANFVKNIATKRVHINLKCEVQVFAFISRECLKADCLYRNSFNTFRSRNQDCISYCNTKENYYIPGILQFLELFNSKFKFRYEMFEPVSAHSQVYLTIPLNTLHYDYRFHISECYNQNLRYN